LTLLEAVDDKCKVEGAERMEALAAAMALYPVTDPVHALQLGVLAFAENHDGSSNPFDGPVRRIEDGNYTDRRSAALLIRAVAMIAQRSGLFPVCRACLGD
jgi:hypothetical protein